MQNIAFLKEPVEKIVREAAQLMRIPFTAMEKDAPSNIVTTADLAVQKFLNEKLTALVPGSAFFGEEGDSVPASAAYLWIVDPIDGTTNFSRGIGECCISVALLREEEPVLGMVYNPYGEKLYSAVKGEGAQCNGQPIHVSGASFRRSLFCTALCLYRKEFAPKCMAVIADAYAECADVRRFGSCALELCYLAEGKCDLFFEFRVFPWDCAAGMLILEEAGGVICGANGGRLQLDRTTPVVAANCRENFEKLNAIVMKHIPEFPYEEILR